MAINRFEVYLVNLDPTVGSKIRKIRPCLVVSPDELNHNIRTVIVAPLTTKARPYPTRIACRFAGKNGQVVLDEIRTVDQVRLAKKLGRLAQRPRPRCWRSCRRCSPFERPPEAQATCRFAILRHDAPRGLHWDLLLETGEVLRTWALPQLPRGCRVDLRCPAGPPAGILGLRRRGLRRAGGVTRWDCGAYRIQSEDADGLDLQIHGVRFSGRMLFCRIAEQPGRWTLRDRSWVLGLGLWKRRPKTQDLRPKAMAGSNPSSLSPPPFLHRRAREMNHPRLEPHLLDVNRLVALLVDGRQPKDGHWIAVSLLPLDVQAGHAMGGLRDAAVDLLHRPRQRPDPRLADP